MFNNALKDTFDISSLILQIFNSPSALAGGIVYGIVHELVRTIEVAKHFEYFIDDFTNSSCGSINLHHLIFTLLITTSGFTCCSKAFLRTNFVWVMGPSVAQTTRHTPSTISIIRSTSPPKSWWPGVSTILISWLLYWMLVALELNEWLLTGWWCPSRVPAGSSPWHTRH